jgi:hypothetical protein
MRDDVQRQPRLPIQRHRLACRLVCFEIGDGDGQRVGKSITRSCLRRDPGDEPARTADADTRERDPGRGKYLFVCFGVLCVHDASVFNRQRANVRRSRSRQSVDAITCEESAASYTRDLLYASALTSLHVSVD